MRILVIEDEPRILDFVSRGLEAEGFSVLGARDGQEGLRAAEAAPWDLVILDLLLPRLDGLSVLRALEAKHPELPVVTVFYRVVQRAGPGAYVFVLDVKRLSPKRGPITSPSNSVWPSRQCS